MGSGLQLFRPGSRLFARQERNGAEGVLTSRYPRDRYILTDKLTANYFKTEADIRPLFESQLAACGVDYFDFAECLSDLVRTEHLTLSADGLYAITDKGLRNSRICESSLPYSVRLRCDKNLAACNRHLRRKSQVKASTEKRPNGTYTVRLELSDDMGSVMDLKLMVPREDMGKILAARFRQAPEKLYSEIIDLLLNTPTPEDEEES